MQCMNFDAKLVIEGNEDDDDDDNSNNNILNKLTYFHAIILMLPNFTCSNADGKSCMKMINLYTFKKSVTNTCHSNTSVLPVDF